MSETGWGSGGWGSSEWGSGQAPINLPPTIIPLDPLEEGVDFPQTKPISFRVTDDVNSQLSTLIVSVGGINFILGGVAQNGASFTSTANGLNGFDIELTLPNPLPLGTRQEVSVVVRDNVANETVKIYFFTVGVGPRLLQVLNPSPELLVAYFNRPMKRDGTFLSPSNWRVEAVTAGALPLTITKVTANAAQANVAFLNYEGGGSTYELSSVGILSQEGDLLQVGFNSVLFDLVFGAEDEPTIRLIDTVFGPVGISQRLRRRRTVDDHTINRSIALGMDEQFRLRFRALDNTVSRSGVPGDRRT